MPFIPLYNLPAISEEDALDILSTPFAKVKSSSDYYKAVFHLSNHPSAKTEKALIDFLESEHFEFELKIAQRKAAEVLGQLGCKSSIPALGRCLKSKDPYLVENAVWSLEKLRCKDPSLHFLMILLLDDPNQNRRVIIQSIARLGLVDALPKIKDLLKNKNLSIGVRGALIAAIHRLSRESTYIHEIRDFLKSMNQNQRHCAVQDVIDSQDINLIPSVFRAPISPSFKIRMLETFWEDGLLKWDFLKIFSSLDSLIIDDSNEINLLHNYKEIPDIHFLVSQLFSTDFSVCYLAMNTLKGFPEWQVISHLDDQWVAAKKDYGALYFFTSLYRFFLSKGIIGDSFESHIEYLMSNKWPDIMKFRPLAIISSMYLNKKEFLINSYKLLDSYQTPFWVNRYTTLICLGNFKKSLELIDLLKISINDNHCFVRAKANSLYKQLVE